MLRTTRQYLTLPSLPTPGPMPPIVSVVIPIARTNLVTNPSIEVNASTYTAIGGSIARSAAQQYHGTYSLAVTPGAGANDGAFYGPTGLTSGQVYAFSCKFRGIAGIPYKIGITTTGGIDLSVVPFIATGRWQWIYGYYLETSSANRRFAFIKNNSTNTGVFYVDGVQIEVINAGELVSTYIDGDQPGLLVGQQPPAYLWTGTPHASTSSRSALTRAGGYVINLSFYNFLLTGLIGLGMATPNNVSIPYTVLDGARYLRTTKPPRTFSLTGRWQSDDAIAQYMAASDMRQAFDRDLVPIQQPLVLLVEPQDECGNVIGDFANIQCIYAGGLEGNDGNLPVEDTAPTFTMYVPFLLGGSGGASLTVQGNVTNANRILQRSPIGQWSAMGTGASGGTGVYALVRGLDGKVYAGGDFTSMGGVANTAGIAYWDGNAWNAMVSGVSGGGAIVLALAVAPNGDIYAGGSFTDIGGSGADNIARWNGSAWSVVGSATAINGTVETIVFDSLGTMFIGGVFTNAGGDANADNLAQWNGSAWSAVGATAINNSVFAIIVGLDGRTLYIGGSFTNAGGVADADSIAKYNPVTNTWSALGTGSALGVRALGIDPAGNIYASVNGTTLGGVTVNYLGRWNGTAWSILGSGLDNTPEVMTPFAGGLLGVGGQFSTANGVTLPDRMALWNGSTWLPFNVDLPSTATVDALLQVPDGTVYVGFRTTGTAVAGGVTAVTNDTPNYVYPRLVINGPSSGTSRIHEFVNRTTRFGVFFNLTLSAGEVATLDFDPQVQSFTTTFQGDISSRLMPGSQPARMYLAPGVNNISFYAVSSTVIAAPTWQKRYNGVADLVN